jgi:hypothetical protein
MKSPLHRHNLYLHLILGGIGGYLIHKEVQSFFESPILFFGYLIPISILISITIHLLFQDTK